MSILQGLQKILEEKLTPLHMPGHKGRNGFPGIMEEFHRIDITEIPGSDNLHHAQGMILEAQREAARIFGAERSYFLVNGTTGGIQSMILSICNPGDKILVPRNCHRSVWSALILGDIQPVYMAPDTHPKTGIGLSISPKTVAEKLGHHPEIKACILTYPSYYGSCSELQKIASILHDQGKRLLVDEAHGAHLAFHPKLPITALEGGCDITVQSTHKILSSYTQSSMLHVGSRDVPLERLEMFLGMLQSSSPSYPLMASLEFAALQAEREGAKKWGQILEWNQGAYDKILKETSMIPLGSNLIGKYSVADYDFSKLFIDVSPTGLRGMEVEEILRRDYGIQVELSDMYHILAMTGMGTEGKDVQRFTNALIEIYNQYKEVRKEVHVNPLPPIQEEVLLTPREAVYAKEQVAALDQSLGRISKEFIIPYPPGIPLVLPGEKITGEILEAVRSVIAGGGHIIGPHDKTLQTLRVVKY